MRHFFERACFFKEMSSARNQPQFLLALKLGISLFVQFDHLGVISSHDEERWRPYFGEMCSGKIWPSTA